MTPSNERKSNFTNNNDILVIETEVRLKVKDDIRC